MSKAIGKILFECESPDCRCVLFTGPHASPPCRCICGRLGLLIADHTNERMQAPAIANVHGVE